MLPPYLEPAGGRTGRTTQGRESALGAARVHYYLKRHRHPVSCHPP